MADIIYYDITEQGRASRVLEFIRGNSNFFYAIGKATPWPDDINPPRPSRTTSQIPEVILYKRALLVKPARIVDCPNETDIKCGDSWFRYYELEDILIGESNFEIYPTHVYVETLIRSDDYSEDGFRAIGIYTGLVPSNGTSLSLQKYLPNQVAIPGLLQWLAYSTPIPRVTGKSHKLGFFIEL